MKTPETKPFCKTSEFWLLLLAAINTIVISNPTDKKTLITDAIAGIYGVARGLAKSGSPYESEAQDVQPTALPQPATSDIQPVMPPADGAGAKGVIQAPVSLGTALETGATDLNKLLADAREIITEHPEIAQQLKAEKVI